MTVFAIFPFRRALRIAGALAAIHAFVFPCAAAPNVVVTIKPIHSLAAAILDGVAEPKLLLDGATSPHSYALKPSDAEALSSADAIIRVSENLEVFLDKAIATLPKNARVIDLESTPGLTLLPVRKDGGPMHPADDGNEEADGHGHEHGPIDVHFWLDPVNAIVIAGHLARQFSEMDPEHAANYKANAEKLEARLAALDAELNAKFKGLYNRPFIVFHDVTQYLEKRYGLDGLGAVTLSPERPPGARRLQRNPRQNRAGEGDLRLLGAPVPAKARRNADRRHSGEERGSRRDRREHLPRFRPIFRAHAGGRGKFGVLPEILSEPSGSRRAI